MRRSRWWTVGPVVLLAVGGAYALASGDWCGPWKPAAPSLLGMGTALGPLSAGAGEADLVPPYPVVVAGYGPPRSEAKSAAVPLKARALLLQVRSLRIGIVSLDVLLVPDAEAEQVRAAVSDLRLSELWVLASHTHSSFGGYDSRLVSELAGTGRYRAPARESVVQAAVGALRRAQAGMQPATLRIGEANAPALVASRDDGTQADPRLTEVRVEGGAAPIAELILFAAHPTLVPRRTSQLDPDYPGRLAAREESADAGVTLFAQGAVGNASAALDGGADPERYAEALEQAVDAVAPPEVAVTSLGYARVSVALPRPDSSRLVPWFSRNAGDNLLCGSASRTATLSVIRLGPLTLLGAPGEVTAEAGQALEAASGANRVVSLVNGYLGYVETGARVRALQGEAKRQYFRPELADALANGAQLAGKMLRLTHVE